jgi:hypothetical protein
VFAACPLAEVTESRNHADIATGITTERVCTPWLLGLSSRSQLDRVLPVGPDTAGPR